MFSKKDYLIVSFGLSIIFLIFFNLISLKYVAVERDYTLIFLPTRTYLASELKQGNFPLWSPQVWAGFPIFAQGEIGTLYPFNLIFIFLPSWVAGNIMIVLNFFFAFLFSFIYLKYIKISSFFSFLGSIVFVFSPYFLCAPTALNVLNTVIWLPLILLFVDLSLQKKKYFL